MSPNLIPGVALALAKVSASASASDDDDEDEDETKTIGLEQSTPGARHHSHRHPPPRAWTIPEGIKFGRLDRLKLLEQEDRNKDEHEREANATATIATRAIGLNFADIFTVLGLYSAANLVRQTGTKKSDSNDKSNSNTLSAFVPGLEFAGIVVDDPTGTFRANERVLGFTRFGAYAERVCVPPVFLLPLPDHWTFAEGASFLVQALTAWHGLVEIGRMPNLFAKNDGDHTTNHGNDNGNSNNRVQEDNEPKPRRIRPLVVIVHSASGGVGLWASEIAARRGGIVLGIVGDEAKKGVFLDRIVRKLSPESRVMIRGKERDFADRLARELNTIHGNGNGGNNSNDSSGGDRESSGGLSLLELSNAGLGADLVMESLGGKYFSASFDSLNDGGALVTFGSTTYSSPGRGGINPFRLVYRYLTRPKIDPGDLTARNLRLCGFNLIYLTEQTEELQRELRECIACLSSKDDATVGHQSGEAKDVVITTNSSRVSLELVTPPVIGERFDFRTQGIDAMEKLKSGKTVGKVVLVNDNDLDR